MPITIIVGEQRGDEGKGRFVDMLAAEHDIVARFNGGPNAGHTVVLPDGRELDLHVIPSGIAYEHTVNVIGSGTYVDPLKLVKEMETVRAAGISLSPKNLMISSAAHLILPHHISADELREAGTKRQGSTKSGIAPVAADKYLRSGVRAELALATPDEVLAVAREGLDTSNELRRQAGLNELNAKQLAEEFKTALLSLRDYVADTVLFVNHQLREGKKLLAEGAQAYLLDIDHGMYPYTTSSSTTVGGVITGLGVSPTYVERVIGIVKTTQSHVGGGPFVTEITDDGLLDRLRGRKQAVDGEFGTTTGRPRRMGYLDLPGLRRAQLVNGSVEMSLTKLDCVSRYGEQTKVCTAYNLGGQTLDVAPASAQELAKCQPIYQELPTWQEDIRDVRKFEDLPKNAQNYVKFIEEQTGVPITLIGVGPQRDQVIVKSS